MLGTTVGQYRITRRIGQGGMGTVYEAEHVLLSKPAAIKILQPEFSKKQDIVKRFFNEARAAAAIRHPGIIEVYDFGWHTDESAYIAMEYLTGESLAQRTARKQLSWSTALNVTRQIASALAAAHNKQIVHRDLKPDNIFLISDPEVPGGERIKLLDFGIAKLAGDQPHQSKTRTGSVMGTPTYMAPEQARGVAIDHRADLYALGCILYELCAGRPPFQGEGAGDVLAAHIHVPPPALSSLIPNVPPAIDLLVARLLVKAPGERLQSAKEVIDAIAAVNTSMLPAIVDRPTPMPQIPQVTPQPTTLSGAALDKPTTITRSSRTRWLRIAAIAGGAAIAVAVAIVVIATRDDDPEPQPEPTPVAQPAPPAPVPAPVVEEPPPSPPEPAPPATIDVAIDTTPSGAEILLDGKRLGKSPYRGTLPRADKRLGLVARLPGYKDKTIIARADAPIDVRVKLDARRAKPTKPKPNRDQSVNPFGK